MIVIGGKGYELMLDHKDGWNPEAFRGRYSEVLDRYDYIIGDWGYSQLRLKGFYRDNHPKVNRDTAISGMVDYINEYCNFGCAYFVLHKLKESPQEGTFKDILIKEVPEPGLDDDLEQEDEPVVSIKENRDSQAKGTGRDRDASGGSGREHATKDRPVREHQSRNHRNKEGQGKKNHKEFQGRGQQGQPNNSKQNREHKDNHSNRPNKQANQNKQDRPEKQDNQNRPDNNQNKQDRPDNNQSKQDN
ncbi:YutD family protein [Paenibacillus sp. FSL R7-0337]|uniref:YutD family protein n=1 Tax=Paenibacillus sp. FSL R7-0337 TaxID=1926588 RepID=UPI0009F85D2F|nr:YutD family protein [Paenibacillus sp. FSL R7-0337]